jgi:arylsulfatase A-like enzyme
MYWEFHEGGFFQAARVGDWKAVRLGTKKPIELYDLKTDPGEARDVAAQNPAVVKQLEDYIKGARFDSALWPINENVPPRKGGGAGKKKAPGE